MYNICCSGCSPALPVRLSVSHTHTCNTRMHPHVHTHHVSNLILLMRTSAAPEIALSSRLPSFSSSSSSLLFQRWANWHMRGWKRWNERGKTWGKTWLEDGEGRIRRMERTEQGEQAGNRSRKAAQTEDFDTKMTSLTGPLSPPHAHIHTQHSSSQYLCSSAWRLDWPWPMLLAVSAFSIQGRSSLSLPGEDQWARESWQGPEGASGGPRQHMDSLTVTGASEDLPSHDVCLCMCVSVYI